MSRGGGADESGVISVMILKCFNRNILSTVVVAVLVRYRTKSRVGGKMGERYIGKYIETHRFYFLHFLPMWT